MAEYGEWNRKGATLSDSTAAKEYGVSREFILTGIREGKLEYREGVTFGNPYLRLLRSQLEKLVGAELGPTGLARKQNETKLRSIKKEVTQIKKRLKELDARKSEIERQMEG